MVVCVHIKVIFNILNRPNWYFESFGRADTPYVENPDSMSSLLTEYLNLYLFLHLLSSTGELMQTKCQVFNHGGYPSH